MPKYVIGVIGMTLLSNIILCLALTGRFAVITPFPACKAVIYQDGGTVDEKIRAAIATFDVPTNVWASHIWFVPGNHHSKAIEVLVRIGGPAVPSLLEILNDPKKEKRYLAILALEKIGDKRAVNPLIRVFEKDTFWGVREGAADALATLRDSRAVEPLLKALRAREIHIRGYAIQALSAFPEPRVIAAIAPFLSVEESLGQDQSELQRLGTEAGYSLGRMGAPALERLLKAAGQPDPTVRYNAALGLGQLREDAAVQALLGLLKDRNREIRTRTVIELGHGKDRKAVPALIAALDDREEQVQGAAADVLGEFGDPAAVPGLMRLLSGRDEPAAPQAAKALGALRARPAVGFLITACASRRPLLRAEAAEALGRIGDQAALETLLLIAVDGDEYVRGNGVGALGAMHDERAYQALLKAMEDSSDYVRRNAATALGMQQKQSAVPALIHALEDKSEEVRGSAAAALGLLRAPEALPALKKMMQNDAWNNPLYLTARNAVDRIEGKKPQ
jgi:HEAT repeat protein